MSATKTNKVLVTGASSLLGVAAIEKISFRGLGRRRSITSQAGASKRPRHRVSVGRPPRQASGRLAFERLTDITRIAYTALHEKPELVAGRVEQGTD
jgi:hypothetical protein